MGFLARLRARLAALLAPTPAPAPAAPALPAASSGQLIRAERRLAEAEARTRRAEEHAKRAEQRLAEAEARARSADERAKHAEQQRKNAGAPAKAPAEDSRKTKQRAAREGKARAKATENRIRAAEERAQVAERNAEKAAGRAQDAAERAKRLEARVLELEATAAQANARAKAAEERASASAPPSSPTAAPASAGRATATVAEVAFSPGEECLQVIRAQISRARRTIDVCVFTITDDRIAAAILDAHRRGVKVRVITDNDKSLDQGSDVERLARAGVAVRKDLTEYHMHHKFAVFDGQRMLTGSYNWTRGAERYNEENLVVSDDPRLVGPFTQEFEALWKKLAPR